MKANNTNIKIAVFQLQKWLLFLSRVDSEVIRVNPDGVFGTETEVAVRQFQLSRGLVPTGTVDLITWEKIKSDYQSAKAKFMNNSCTVRKK